MSILLVTALAGVPANRGTLRSLAAALAAPTHVHGPAELQDDAIRLALRTFGIGLDDPAVSLELSRGGGETGLARVPLLEDRVIEHDARSVPGYDLVGSELTGRALFRRGEEELEVFTANRGDLEHVLGVDLVYLNRSRQNLVMVQYKMLEPLHAADGEDDDAKDWIFRPDGQFEAEIERMRRFAAGGTTDSFDYRINPSALYLKFVRRDAGVGKGGVIMPLDHFDVLRSDPSLRGPRGGFRVTFKTLRGRYLREVGFLDLIRSGYIGSHSSTTESFRVLINAVLRGNRALVLAIQSSSGGPTEDADG